MKKLLTFLFALSCATNIFAYDCKIKGVYYNINEADKTATVTYKYNHHYSGSIVIPNTITYQKQTYSVTTIGECAFGECAFDDCDGLTSVTIPNSVTTIGRQAFYGCSGLTSITIPNSVTTIGEWAFWGCRSLTSVTFAENSQLTTIGKCAFCGCDGLTSVTIPNSVTTIGEDAFDGCDGLTSVTIGNSVTSIGENAFYGCGLTSVTFAENSQLTTIGKCAFVYCSGLTSVTIPNSVTTIGEDAFRGCNGLRDIYYPEHISYINTGNYSTKQHPIMLPFADYAKAYIEPRINEWQKKDKYEKTEDWQKRVNEVTRQQKINEYLQMAKNEYLTKYKKCQTYSFTIGDYDADNEAFLIHEDNLGDLIVPVGISDAQYVEENWKSRTVTPHYAFAGSEVLLQSVDFEFPNNKTYTYKSDQNLTYAQADIQYNFDPIEIDLGSNAGAPQPKGQQTIEQKKLTIGKSDVDTDIPTTGKSSPNTFAVIISNENYTKLKEVPCAINDGEVFAQYCEKTIGLPKDNIRLYTNATYGMMVEAVRNMRNIANAYNGDINIIFYYSGHGAPIDDTKEAYLLPVDAFGVSPEVCYSLNRLYKELADMKAKSVTMFLDACFSGATKDGDMLASVRGVAIKAKANAPQGNMVVFSAASDEQTALPYLDMGHGMFTYYLLKKLKETKGDVTYQALGDYVKQEVYRRSSVKGKAQTPTISASATAEGWQDWKLK